MAELVELGLGAVAHGVIGRVGHVLLGVLDGLRKLGRVELDEVNGRLGENGQPAGETSAKPPRTK